jgi:hypothetical protein
MALADSSVDPLALLYSRAQMVARPGKDILSKIMSAESHRSSSRSSYRLRIQVDTLRNMKTNGILAEQKWYSVTLLGDF